MEYPDRISGRIVDVVNRRIFSGTLEIKGGRINRIVPGAAASDRFILPGFVDSHVHIESSLLVPSEFARMALRYGTVATVSDPHEIANVLGVDGIDFMVRNGAASPLKFHFGVPSCVPATALEAAGAELDAGIVASLLRRSDMFFLGEMMNYPAVLGGNIEVLEKISHARKLGKPVDGHAPGLRDMEAQAYIAAGIDTDHECLALEEARDKADRGMSIQIREGSAARNFDALHPLLASHPRQVMFCCDDLHPDELMLRHIDDHVRRAVALGYDLYDVLAAASVNPVRHYRLPVGLLQQGDPADMIVVNDLTEFAVEAVIIDGRQVVERGRCLAPSVPAPTPNIFRALEKRPDDFRVAAEGEYIRVIEALDGQVLTGALRVQAPEKDGVLVSDTCQDILKIALVNRYEDAAPTMAFVKNFGIRRGALASSVAHDSHNIIAVGADDESICRAVNLVIRARGGLSLVDGSDESILELPVAGLMSTQDGLTAGQGYRKLESAARAMGSTLHAPFMTLSFMALLVIPRLKLGDRGLFDGEKFRFVGLSCRPGDGGDCRAVR